MFAERTEIWIKLVSLFLGKMLPGKKLYSEQNAVRKFLMLEISVIGQKELWFKIRRDFFAGGCCQRTELGIKPWNEQTTVGCLYNGYRVSDEILRLVWGAFNDC